MHVAEMFMYLCTDHDHVYPVGVASVVIAETVDEAIQLLDIQLLDHGLQPFAQSPYTFTVLPLEKVAVVLRDGDY
jgi:hypothetical protein